MGRRSRKRSVSAAAPRPAAPAPPRTSRSEARNAEVRAQLRPLAPGEQPLPLLIAIAISVVLGVGNLVAYAAGQEIDGDRPAFFGIALLSGLLLVAAVGMWQGRYWAVLGFQALLGITVVLASLALLVAGNLAAVLVSVAIAGLGGWLFWKLVRIMARLQMPRPGGGGAIR
jgi:uncharacterized membrane protein YccC